MWLIWLRSEISSGKDFEIFWNLLKLTTTVLKASPLYWIPSTVLMLSPTVLMLSPACTGGIPQCTEYPPQYWTTSTILKVSPTVLMLSPHVPLLSPIVLNNFHNTEGIPTGLMLPHLYCCYPPQYWSYPSTVLMLSPACTDVTLHCTEQPPQYWSYPPTVLKLSSHSTEAICQLYWATFTVQKLSPAVLKLSPHSTDVISPIYWTTSAELNRRYMECLLSRDNFTMLR